MRDSKIESFCEVLSYGFMLCCQICMTWAVTLVLHELRFVKFQRGSTPVDKCSSARNIISCINTSK